MTEEEIEQKIADAKKEAEEAAEAAIKAKDEEIESLKNKDTNFAKLRSQAETAQKEAAEAKERIATLEKNQVEVPKNDSLSRRVGSDEELKKKVEAEYEKLGKEAKTPEEIDKAMDDAYLIVTGKRYTPDVIRNGGSSVGGFRAPVRRSGDGAPVDQAVKDFSTEFNKYGAGITDEDLDPNGPLMKTAAKKRSDHEGK